jgi:diguanylate cyclase (GGDEF)-like protein/PAS domain S-box-containing protein
MGALSRGVLLVVLPVSGLLLVASDALSRWNLSLYDWLIPLVAPPASPEVVLVTIDRHSLDEMGRWPWPRSIHAELIDRLSRAGAQAIGFDVLFAEPDREDSGGDAALVGALSRSARVVLPMAAESVRDREQPVETLPLLRLAQTAAAIGHTDIEVDVDGVVRSVFLKAGIGEAHWAVLPLAMRDLVQPSREEVLPGQRNPDSAQASPYNWVRDYRVWLPFAPRSELLPRYSYIDVLRGEVDPAAFRDRFVLVGVTAAGLGNAFAVPNDPARRGLYGVEIQAQTLAALLRGATIQPLSTTWQLLLTMLVAALPVALYPYIPARWTPVATGAVAALLLVLSAWLLRGAHIWYPAAPALLLVLVSYPLWSWQQLAYAVRSLRRELQWLEPAVPAAWRHAGDFTPEIEFLARLLGAKGVRVLDAHGRIVAGWGSEPASPDGSVGEGVWRCGAESVWTAWRFGGDFLRCGLDIAPDRTQTAAQRALVQAFLQRLAAAQRAKSTKSQLFASLRGRVQRVEQTDAQLQSAHRVVVGGLGQIAGGVVIADPVGEVVFVNAKARAYLRPGGEGPWRGRPLSQLLTELSIPDQADGWQRAVSDALLLRRVTQLSARIRSRDLWLQVAPYSAGPVLPSGVFLSFVDVTAARKAEQQALARRVLEEKERALVTLSSIGEAVITTDCDGIVEYVNPAAQELLGCSSDRLRGRFIGEALRVFQGRGGNRIDWPLQNCLDSRQSICLSSDTVLVDFHEQVHDVRVSLAPIRTQDSPSSGVVLAISDISAVRSMARALEHQASHDGLTGLPNRSLLRDRLAHAIAQARRAGCSVAALFLDVDRFKHINDGLGHDAGDALLVAAAQRLRAIGGEQHTIARLGGDEFVVVVEGVEQTDVVADVAGRLLDSLAQPIGLRGHEISVSVSVGVSLYPQDGQDADTLLRNAHRAMYRAKKEGGNAVMFYAEDMNIRAMERLLMEKNLRRAIQRGELQVHYQPQLDLHSGAVIGAEALLRWEHPDLGSIPPDVFVPLAEETGLIFPISEWVMAKVCDDIKGWSLRAEDPFRVSLNLSARQFSQGQIAEVLATALRAAGLAGRHLGIEITESTIMRDVDGVARTLQQLKALGVALAVDDFGTGYSSLSYLKRFPIDRLKIDKSFVRDVTTNADDAAIATAVIAMAHSMGRRVVAEGVETLPQLRFLQGQGCDEMQGFYFSAAVPATQMAGMFSRSLDTALA